MSTQPRGPVLFDADDPAVVVSAPPARPEPDADPAADGSAGGEDQPAPPLSSGLGGALGWGAVFISAMGGLAVLAATVSFAHFVSSVLARDDWLGWGAAGLLGLAGLAAVVLIGREIVGFFRLARIGRVRRDADRALAERDVPLEKAAVRRIRNLLSRDRQREWDIARFREEERHMREPGDLMRLADRVLLAGADKEARRVVFESARRVATVTALIPFGGLVVLFVVRENVRMMRRLAGVYGARPGFAGALRLLWHTISYIAATGLIALSDDLVGQFLGQDILRRLSRRLGESAFNAALTARLGSAAVAVCRPLPFLEAPPIRARDVVRELFAGMVRRSAAGSAKP